MHPFRTVVPLVLAAFSIEANAAVFEVKSFNYTSRLSRLHPGDTLRLTGGTYPGLVVRGLHGTRDAWITISGPESGSPARIVGSACCNTVEISNSSFIIIRNFTIDSRGIDGAFGISAKDGLNNLTHHVIIQNNTLVGQNGSQQTVGISTKSPTWAWIIRNNKIIGAGTGIYLGDSDGRMPFVGGIIENNLIVNTIGYNIEIKWQRLRPDVKGMVTTPQSTIIRNNVFIKDDQPSPDGDRPNVLVGGFPESGPGSTDIYEVYGNFFFYNPREALFQGSGRVSLHDNIFVGGDDAAIVLQAQDLPLKLAHVYNNTVYAEKQGIVFGSPAKLEDSVIGNLVLASLPFSGPIVHAAENLTDRIVNAGSYVRSPSFRLGEMDFYPLANKCRGAPLDLSAFGLDTDYAKDFNGIAKDSTGQGIVFRGGYAGEGVNPGWMLAPAIKSVSAGPSPLALELFPSTPKRRFNAQARLTGAPSGHWFGWTPIHGYDTISSMTLSVLALLVFTMSAWGAGWTRLSNTTLANLCPSGTQGNCSAVVEAWSGGIVDNKRNRLILFGGGHGDYNGNEVYAVYPPDSTPEGVVCSAASAPAICRIKEHSSTLRGVSDPSCYTDAPDGTNPNSRHTYQGIAYLDDTDRMFINGGSVACGSGGHYGDTWILDLSSLTWASRDPARLTGGGLKPRDICSPCGSTGQGPWVNAVYDPATRLVYLQSSAFNYLWSFDESKNTYKVLNNSYPPLFNVTWVLDTKRHQIYIFGGGENAGNPATQMRSPGVAAMINIAPRSNYSTQNLNVSGCAGLVGSASPGLAYDSAIDRIVGWPNFGNTIYLFDPATRTCTTQTYTNGPPDSRDYSNNAYTTGTFGRFQYLPSLDIFLLVNDAHNDAYALRLEGRNLP